MQENKEKWKNRYETLLGITEKNWWKWTSSNQSNFIVQRRNQIAIQTILRRLSNPNNRGCLHRLITWSVKLYF